MLFIIPTPIGNLEDITYRAVKTLCEVDYIACEDTRKSWVLLKHYHISTPTLSYHAHSWHAKVEKILDMLHNGKKVALISDAGTPWISDPGYQLINACIQNNIEISSLPWACAAITALSASGMSSHHFVYLGFLPIKKWRQKLLKRISENKTETIIIYESVHRIQKTLLDISEYFWKQHDIVIGRELTKKFEEYIRGDISQVLHYFSENPGKIKWEFVIIL